MSNVNPSELDSRIKIARFLATVAKDPVKFVDTIFLWGSGQLYGAEKPLPWQYEVLNNLRDGLITKSRAIQIAVSSGHGVGKSALVAWIILWGIATKKFTRGVVTANTENQMKRKTWAELAKWFNSSILTSLFIMTDSAIYPIRKSYRPNWRIDLVSWSAHNSEAFAGLHNQLGRTLIIFDEASAIDDKVWEVTEGATIDAGGEVIWCVFGNPTRAKGRFFDCFHSLKNRWLRFQINAEDIPLTDKGKINEWISDYGSNSDFIRVRVRGEFPINEFNQLIPYEFINQSRERKITLNDCRDEPKIIGVDVARFGDDSSAILLRQGRVIVEIIRINKVDTMQLASKVDEKIAQFKPDAVFIDQSGVGGGVVDRLHQLGRYIYGVDFGSSPTDKDRYTNLRAEIWFKMMRWIKDSGKLIDDKELIDDLIAPTYYYVGDKGQIALEKKSDMKKRGVKSPDSADALALTFAYDIISKKERDTFSESYLSQNDYQIIDF